MTLHFAYGSNMSRTGMNTRCPGARAIGIGALQGFRFFIMTNGYASVVRAPDAVVHGVVWRITPRDLAALNAYENVDSGLYRRAGLPVATGAGKVRALVYLGCETGEGRPRPGYMNMVVDAAREWRLPADYVCGLERWTSGYWQGSRRAQAGGVA